MKSYLGRNAARGGRFEEALETLQEARAIYESDNVLSETLLMDARIAECLAFAVVFDGRETANAGWTHREHLDRIAGSMAARVVVESRRISAGREVS